MVTIILHESDVPQPHMTEFLYEYRIFPVWETGPLVLCIGITVPQKRISLPSAWLQRPMPYSRCTS